MRLELDGLTHRYGGETAVEDISVTLKSGELLGIVGPSGCGKTTIVQAITGHIRPTAGRVLLGGSDVTEQPPEGRGIGVVFQRSTLYPHMTVGENVSYAVEARETERRTEPLVTEYLGLVGLSGRRDAYPGALSGGQRRRVELARALSTEPDVLVLDEPLSALDRGRRQDLRDEINRIQDETGVTTVYVTHDQETALTLADRLLVVEDGQVRGRGSPRALYRTPPSEFVAQFLGDLSTLHGHVVSGEPPTVEWNGYRFVFEGDTASVQADEPYQLYVRPEAISQAEEDGGFEGTITVRATVDRVTHSGSRSRVRATCGNTSLEFETDGFPGLTGGETVTVAFDTSDVFAFLDGSQRSPSHVGPVTRKQAPSTTAQQ